ncbi:MAG: MFS transporter [Deltaproteobacteria bacterium]|nr:MFS transporter [Deltaproteobacteria bacterium]
MDQKRSKESAFEQDADFPLTDASEMVFSRRSRLYIAAAALLALFLGALDALVMSAAMPTIIADLGGLHLYSWVYSAYFLARAVSLPIFGKLADIFNSKRLFIISISIFLVASIFAGLAQSMTQLVVWRVFQGIGGGGIFALVYIVLTDISSPENRAKNLSLGSFIWGLASVLGPTFGGFVVTYLSWRWIFFVNVPLSILCLLGIGIYLVEIREKKKEVAIDYLGALTLSTGVLGLLAIFLLAGRAHAWASAPIILLLAVTIISGIAFYFVEKRASEPILSINFFGTLGFSAGNGAAFLASFSIFALFAYSPLFIQGALGKTPLEMSLAMLSLSLGWSAGALSCGQLINRIGKKPSTILGSLLLVVGGGLTLGFSTASALITCVIVLGFIGVGMGFVSMATLLIVQDSLDVSDLGVATASHQFFRTLGGTVGVGVSGSFVTAALAASMDSLIQSESSNSSPSLSNDVIQNVENLFRPEVQALLTPDVQKTLQIAVSQGVSLVFWIALCAAFVCLLLSLILPKDILAEPDRRS